MPKIYRQGTSLTDEIQRTTVPVPGVALWHLGQSCVLGKGAGRDAGEPAPTFVIDPYLTRSIEVNQPETEFIRAYEAPMQPEDLRCVAVVLLTHHHDDHMDLSTLERLHRVSPNTRFVLPAPHKKMLTEAGIPEECLTLAYAGEVIHMAGMEILPVAAAHTSYETDEDGAHLYLGYVLIVGGIRIYHSGDTLVTDELVETIKAARPQIVMLPINGGDYYRTRRDITGNMTAREAVDFAAEAGADLFLPNHYDMFPNNREQPRPHGRLLVPQPPAGKVSYVCGRRAVHLYTIRGGDLRSQGVLTNRKLANA